MNAYALFTPESGDPLDHSLTHINTTLSCIKGVRGNFLNTRAHLLPFGHFQQGSCLLNIAPDACSA